MPTYNYAELGRELAAHWGIRLDKALSEVQRTATDAQRTVWLLAAAVAELRSLRQAKEEVARTFARPKTAAASPVSDGMFRAIRRAAGGDRLPEDRSMLSVRARKILIRTGAEYVSDLNRRDLLATKNCGEVTTNELLEWAARGPLPVEE